MSYARLDTHFLIPLRDRLKKELEQHKRWDLAVEDFQRLCKISPNEVVSEGGNGRDPLVACGRIKGAHDLSPHQLAVLKELCIYRDHLAKSLDRPLFKVIGDDTLLAVAANMPRSLNELRQLPGMSKGQIQRHGTPLLRAVERGLHGTPIQLPRSHRPDERFLNRLDILRQWRKDTAHTMGVKSDIILPRDLLHALAEQNPQTTDEVAEVLSDVPWRIEHFGESILKVLRDGEG